jgi:hypothetical protein
VAQAASLAREQGSANVWMSIETTIPDGDITLTGEGAFDMAESRGHLTFTATGTGQGAAAAEQVGTMEAVYDDFVAYMRMPVLERLLPEGKKWIKIDFQAVGKETGVDFQQLAQLGQNNPMQQLDYLKGATDIEEVGTEDVRGTETTHYKGVLDFDSLKEQVPEGAGGSIDRIKAMTGIEKAPIEVWLDSEGLPRRVSYRFDYDIPATATSSAQPGQIAATIEYFDFGTDVTVEVPRADEIYDPAEAQQG